MWLFSWIPDVLYHIVLALATLSFICCLFIPSFGPLTNFRESLKLVSVLVIISCVYVEGKITKEHEFQAKLDKLSAELVAEQQKSASITNTIQYVYVDRVKTVKDVQVVYRDRIKTIAAEIDKSCQVDPKAIDLLNSASRYPISR